MVQWLSMYSVAADRGWFKTYTPLQTTFGFSGSEDVEAIGIGTIHLAVKRSLTSYGPRSHNILVLHDVLHYPSECCNVLAVTGGLDKGQTRKGEPTFGNAKSHAVLFQERHTGLQKARLSGIPVGPLVGPSRMKGGAPYKICARWPEEERFGWNQHQLEVASDSRLAIEWGPAIGPGLAIKGVAARDASRFTGQSTAMVVARSPPYTKEETIWMKAHYKGEFNFLPTHGLKIHDEKDRDEGRRMLRALMEKDEQESGVPQRVFEDEFVVVKRFNPGERADGLLHGVFTKKRRVDAEADVNDHGPTNQKKRKLR